MAWIMRTTITVLIAPCFGLPASAQVTANVLSRVVQVRSGAETCSAFTIDIEDLQYLVTARHCLKSDNDSRGLEIRSGTSWAPVEGAIILPSNKDVDIAAIALTKRLTVELELQPTADGIVMGQPVYFLGFPSDLSTKWSSPSTTSTSEMAFIKAGVLSAMDSRNPQAVILYIDGHNNPGFSGGPIVFRPSPGSPFRVAAVVQGFKGEGTAVVKRRHLRNPKAPAYKDLYTRANAGIVVGYSIENIVKAIGDAQQAR